LAERVKAPFFYGDHDCLKGLKHRFYGDYDCHRFYGDHGWLKGLKHRFYGDHDFMNFGSTLTILHIVAPLDKALYDKYLCLVASNKQQITREEIKELNGKLGNRIIV